MIVSLFNELVAVVQEILEIYATAFSQLKVNAVSFGGLVYGGPIVEFPSRLLGAVDEIGASWGQHTLNLQLHNATMVDASSNPLQYHAINIVRSGKFQLVAPTCLGLALLIIVLSSEFASDPIRPSKPTAADSAKQAAQPPLPIASSSQVEQFAVQKAISIIERSEIRTPVLNRQNKPEDTPASMLTGDSDNYMDTRSIYSLDQTDDGLSQISKLDLLDNDLAIIMKQSKLDPTVLEGWKISVKGKGVGVIVEVVRRFAMTTMFRVKFESGKTELLPLKRSTNKGTVAFTPITKVQ